MSEGSFLGVPISGWVTISAFLYAIATFALAWVTHRVSDKSIKAAAEGTSKQISASREAALIQARASSVSNNRQHWINALRDEVTGFLTKAENCSLARDPREQMILSRALTEHAFKVRLLLNPTEGESTQLVEMLSNIRNEAGGFSDEDREKIVLHTQKILKKEWERVKSGE